MSNSTLPLTTAIHKCQAEIRLEEEEARARKFVDPSTFPKVWPPSLCRPLSRISLCFFYFALAVLYSFFRFQKLLKECELRLVQIHTDIIETECKIYIEREDLEGGI